MNADWKALAREAGFRVSSDNSIEVRFEGGGRQLVQADPNKSGSALYLWSVIATPRTLRDAASQSALRYAWERNRLSDLLGFSVDGRGRLIGESWVPYEGLTAAELELQVRELARVCDWHELRLAGTDAY